MMVVLVSVLSCFLLQTKQVPPANDQAKTIKTAQKSKNVANQSQIPNTPSKTVGNAKPPENDADQNQANGGNSSRKVGDINAASTVVIAFFTALTFGVFLYQIKVAHDAERAWIVVSDIHKPDHLEWIDMQPAIYPKETFSWTIKNTGRTPARILSVRLRFRFVQNLNQLSPRPDYGSGKCILVTRIPTEGAILPQNEPTMISTYFEGADGEASAPTQDQIDAVRLGTAFLIAYGSVSYRDIFKRKHETRFSHVYHVRMPTAQHVPIEGWFSAGGPESYNVTS